MEKKTSEQSHGRGHRARACSRPKDRSVRTFWRMEFSVMFAAVWVMASIDSAKKMENENELKNWTRDKMNAEMHPQCGSTAHPLFVNTGKSVALHRCEKKIRSVIRPRTPSPSPAVSSWKSVVQRSTRSVIRWNAAAQPATPVDADVRVFIFLVVGKGKKKSV